MVEYGGGIQNGPAGQVGGGGAGAPELAQPVDLFSSVGNAVNDAASMVLALTPEMLALVIVAFFVGLVVLKRAF